MRENRYLFSGNPYLLDLKSSKGEFVYDVETLKQHSRYAPSALYSAASQGLVDITRALLERGLDPNQQENGHTLLHTV